MEAATAPPGRAELEDLRARVERLEERTLIDEMRLALAGWWRDQWPEPDVNQVQIIGEYTIAAPPPLDWPPGWQSAGTTGPRDCRA
jgi:hypothetical protein